MTMQKGQNFNHPVTGSSTFVEPIRDLAKIAAIKELLSDRPRNLAIFTLGINTNLRASDLLAIRVGQVRGLKVEGELTLTEKKTGKRRRITMNEACVKTLSAWLMAMPPAGDKDFLFIDPRTGKRLSVPSLCGLVKDWCAKAGLRGNFSSHTLRKTWGYHQFHTYHVELPYLMVCFNHAGFRQTIEYLGIQPAEIGKVYMNII